MTEIIASNNSRLAIGTACVVKTDFWGKPNVFIVIVKFFDQVHVPFESIKVEVLDEEKSKSFLGSAGVGLVGAALLGPLGLVAGALAGGNKHVAVFGLTFEFEDATVKLVIKTNSKSEITYFKERSFLANVS